MIITRTPYRMSFFGGGTDYPVWFREEGGAVLATTIDRCCYISCRYLPPFFEHRSRVVYSRIEMVSSNRDIEHPAVRGVLQYLGVEDGVEIHHDGDLPARTGLGSSSAFTVGLLQAVHALKGHMPTKMELARQAIYVEQELLKESVGCQDQVLAAFGGLQRVDFDSDGEIRVTPIVLRPGRLDELKRHLMLYFTGFSRTASEIAREQIQQTPSLTAKLRMLRGTVDDAQGILVGDGDIGAFGRLLHDAWQIKRGLTSKIADAQIDAIYDTARTAGAIGGKLLGAGGGGFMVLFVPPESQGRMRDALRGLLEVPFGFDRNGSQVVVYQPDQGSSEPLLNARPSTARSAGT
jgi:D-glycero-alpha-D-manno-heptose-7-phosphate kinase